MSADYEHVLANKQEQDTELRELRQNKELLSQWERQIADIIQWVTEEKDARAYLKTMAKKLREDVDNLKTTAGVLGRVRATYLLVVLDGSMTIIPLGWVRATYLLVVLDGSMTIIPLGRVRATYLLVVLDGSITIYR